MGGTNEKLPLISVTIFRENFANQVKSTNFLQLEIEDFTQKLQTISVLVKSN